MSYHTYLIIGPTNKFYVGISKNVKERWRSHKDRAFKDGKKHPLYDSMRKYGEAAFHVLTVADHTTVEEAQASEVATIKTLEATDRAKGYNLSPGGEYDALIGPKIFWDRMRADPVAYDGYRANLSAAQKLISQNKSGHERAKGLLAFQQSLSPRERYYRSRRALRIAGTRWTPQPIGRLPPHGPKSAAKLASITNRKNVTVVWAGRSDDAKAAIFDKISTTLKEKYQTDEVFRMAQEKSARRARRFIDKEKQSKAASQGQKAWWAELKKDPVRYGAYISSRRESLMKTLEAKKNAG